LHGHIGGVLDALRYVTTALIHVINI